MTAVAIIAATVADGTIRRGQVALRIAITGMTGFVGGAIARRLAAEGHSLIAITRSGRAVVSTTTEVRPCADLFAERDLSHLVRDTDAVINCAARVHQSPLMDATVDEALHQAANADFPARLAEAAKAAGTTRFIQMSSVAAIASCTQAGVVVDDATPPLPTNAYGRAKLAADDTLAGLSGAAMPIITLRPPAVFGPGVGAQFALLLRAAKLGLPLPVGAVRNQRSFIALDNLADAVALAATSALEGSYIVTDSAPLSTADLYARLMRGFGYPPRVWRWPPSLVRGVAGMALGQRAASLLGDAAFSGRVFAEASGWQPCVDFDAAIRQTVDAVRRG